MFGRRMLPRVTLDGRRVVETVNDFNEVIDITTTSFKVKNCTVQPYEGAAMTPDQSGYKQVEAYTIFTDTELKNGKEGTNQKPDEIKLGDKWYKVIRVKIWRNSVIPHYECIVIDKDGGLI